MRIRSANNMEKCLLMLLCAALVCGGAFPVFSANAEAELPIVMITSDGSLEDWGGKEDVRNAVLTYVDWESGYSFSQEITIKPQGNTSLGYPKKNFNIKLLEEDVEMQPGWGAHAKYCLKSNYTDPTQACNVVSNRLAAEMNAQYGLFEDMPNHGQIDGFPVWVTLNGEDMGLYTWNMPKAAWTYGLDKQNDGHILMEALSWKPSTMFLSAEYEADGSDWAVEVGPDTVETKDKFSRLLHFIVNSTDEEFKQHVDEYLDLDALLNYWCFFEITMASDNCGKNILFITKNGTKWAPVLYDLDSLWGIDYTGKQTLSAPLADLLKGIEISFDMETLEYFLTNCTAEARDQLLAEVLTVLEQGFSFLARILRCYPNEFYARYHQLRGGALSDTNIRRHFDAFMDDIPQEYYDRNDAIWPEEKEFIRSRESTYQYIDEYLPVIDGLVSILCRSEAE